MQFLEYFTHFTFGPKIISSQRAGRGKKNPANGPVKAEDEGDSDTSFKYRMKKNYLSTITIFQKCFKSPKSNEDS